MLTINQFHYHARAGFDNHCGPKCEVGKGVQGFPEKIFSDLHMCILRCFEGQKNWIIVLKPCQWAADYFSLLIIITLFFSLFLSCPVSSPPKAEL